MADEPRKFWGWAADEGGCAFYRIITPIEALTDDDVGVGTVMPNSIIDEPDRLVVLQRSTNPKAMMVLDHFQQQGRPWVYDTDDLLWHITPDNPAFRHYSNPIVRGRLDWHVRNAPLFTASTALLADEARRAGAGRVSVVPNVLPDRLFDHARDALERRLRAREDPRTVVFWRGSPTHSEDVKVLGNTLRRISRRDDVRLVFAGADYRKVLGVPDAEHLPWVNSPEEYIRAVIDLSPDFALCPLAHTRFNASKSHVAALEASLAGAWPICSKVPAYNGFIDDEVTGHLVPGHPDRWYKTLVRLLDEGPDIERSLTAYDNAFQYRASELKDQYRELLLSV